MVASALGLLGWIVTVIGSWIPSFWGDEAASVMSAERPLSTLWPELGRVDAVHGTYYLFLHFWIDLFGASELSVRFPSTVAVGFVVAGTVVLGDLLFRRRVAVFAGIVCIVLPRVDYMGAEGRSYAIGTAMAVWLTVLFVTLVRRRTRTALPWLAYGLVLAASVYVFLYLVLLAVVHGIVLLASRRSRPLLRPWFVAVVGAVVLASPVIYYATVERHQISFLAHRHYLTFERLAVLQWFGNPWMAAAGWALVIVAVVALARRRSAALVLTVSWLLVPMLLLLLGNELLSPMYTIRYLSFCAPAVALLVAVGVSTIGRDWVRLGVLALLVALVIPTDVFQRSPYAKDDGSDWRQLAEVVAANAHAGDDVVFDNTPTASRKPRLALRLYPQDFARLTDVTLRTPYFRRAGLWDAVSSVAEVGASLTPTVWDVELSTSPTHVNLLELQRLGYTVTKELPVHRTVVYELTKANP